MKHTIYTGVIYSRNIYSRAAAALLVILSSGLFVYPCPAQQAQEKDPLAAKDGPGRAVIIGEIQLEKEGQKIDSYEASQQAAINYFKAMAERTKLAAAGKKSEPASLPEGAINYLTGVYLYCASKSGTCPLVPEAILEADILNSRLSGTADCPNMKAFWTYWVKSDMEQRLGFLIKTNFMSAVTEFNTKVRPAFIRCEDTVKEKVKAGQLSDEAFFKERYAPAERPSQLPAKMVTLLGLIKEKVPNVFYATGAMK